MQPCGHADVHAQSSQSRIPTASPCLTWRSKPFDHSIFFFFFSWWWTYVLVIFWLRIWALETVNFASPHKITIFKLLILALLWSFSSQPETPKSSDSAKKRHPIICCLCTNMKHFFSLSANWRTHFLHCSNLVLVKVHSGCKSFCLPLPILLCKLVFAFTICPEYLACAFTAWT